MSKETEYDPHIVEKKWQESWEKESYGQATDSSNKPKHYHLVEFPYPSGAGLHVGHCMGYGASDAYCRMKRMQGFNVMYPMGWDAFGLPTENYAIKNKVKPADVTKQAVEAFKNQMRALAYSFDWSREINTTDPDYYRWTQWIFLQFYKHAYNPHQLPLSKGESERGLIEVADDDTTTPRLAFQAEMPVNWCPSCKIVLANEEVIAGNCERCGAQTEKRKQKQWMLRITAYADHLIEDLGTVDYLEKIKTQQINWIGKSNGANIKFKIVIASEAKQSIVDEKIATSPSAPRNDKMNVEVFTTRVDTLYGATFMVIAPEHPLVQNIESRLTNIDEVKAYIDKAKKKSDLERTELQKEKAGVELKGVKAINPINKEEIPIYIADYILASYGTGACMAVPAHDQRDFEFAKKYGIPIKQVIAPYYSTTTGPDAIQPDKETVKRQAVLGLVKHWSRDEYYLLDWTKFDWRSLVIGGVEDGETNEKAIEREVKEETGYQDIKLVQKIGPEMINHFFARHKGVNRYGWFNAYLVELGSDKFIKPKEEDIKNHDGSWIDASKVDRFLTLDHHRYIWNTYLKGDSSMKEYGVLINSAEFNDLPSEEAKKNITERLKLLGAGDFAVNFKLRDWIFSRQHYWGEPIPIVHCDKCGIVPVPEDQLPVVLPEVENYEPTDSGESPLAKMTDWVNVKCPKCGGDAKRETDTMPNWAGSSWYFIAYAMKVEGRKWKVDSGNIFEHSEDKLKHWLPIDIYNGGMEHTTLHLLYSRFWHKFLHDLGAVPTSEPYAKRIAHGIILGPDGRKMSKSFGNVINPDDIVKQFGADTLRAYIMFIGPYDQESAWSTAGVQGVSRFLKRVWNNQTKVSRIEPHPTSPSRLTQPLLGQERSDSKGEENTDSKELLIKLNQTIAGVTQDLENFRMNTVISKLMELNNTIEKVDHISIESFSVFLRLLFVACPHIASELWENTGLSGNIYDQKWPEADKKYLIADEIEIVVQVNGKIKDKLKVPADISDSDLKTSALASDKIKTILSGKQVTKTIIVPGKLVSIVTN